MTAAVAVLALIDDAIATLAILCNLVGFVEKTEASAIRHPLIELHLGASAELVRLDALFAPDLGPHDAPVPVRACAISHQIWLVMPESQIVTYGVGQVGSQDVRLKGVDVHTDPNGFVDADGAYSGYGGPSVLIALTSAGNWKTEREKK